MTLGIGGFNFEYAHSLRPKPRFFRKLPQYPIFPQDPKTIVSNHFWQHYDDSNRIIASRGTSSTCVCSGNFLCNEQRIFWRRSFFQRSDIFQQLKFWGSLQPDKYGVTSHSRSSHRYDWPMSRPQLMGTGTDECIRKRHLGVSPCSMCGWHRYTLPDRRFLLRVQTVLHSRIELHNSWNITTDICTDSISKSQGVPWHSHQTTTRHNNGSRSCDISNILHWIFRVGLNCSLCFVGDSTVLLHQCHFHSHQVTKTRSGLFKVSHPCGYSWRTHNTRCGGKGRPRLCCQSEATWRHYLQVSLSDDPLL